MAYGSMITENGEKGRVTNVKFGAENTLPNNLAIAINMANSPTPQQINAAVDTALSVQKNLPNNGKGGFVRGQ